MPRARFVLGSVVALLGAAVLSMGQVQPSTRILLSDNGTPQGSVRSIDFAGAGVTTTVSGVGGTVTIPGGGTPGGSDTQVQFNDVGAFAGDTGFTFNKTTNTLTVDAIVSALTGNASTATALAANPADCASDRYATTIAANGDLTCAQVSLSAGVTGTLPIGSGGTGQTTATAAFDALSPLTTRGDILTRDASNNVRLAIGSIYQGPVSNGTDLSYRSISFIGGFVAPTFTTSSTSYVDVTGLTIALPPNLIFAFDCYGTFTTSATTNGLGISVNGTGGTGQAAQYTLWLQTTAMNTSGNNTTSTTPFSIRNENTFDSMTALASVVSVSTSLVWQMKGFYYSGSSGNSTMAVRVRSEGASPASASIQVGSYCLMTKQG